MRVPALDQSWRIAVYLNALGDGTLGGQEVVAAHLSELFSGGF